MSEKPRRRPHKRPRPQSSCAICHRRKVKCSKTLPCLQCIRHGCAEDCRFDGIPPPRTDAVSIGIERRDALAASAPELDRAPLTPISSSESTADCTAVPSEPAQTTLRSNAQQAESRLPTHDLVWQATSTPQRGRTYAIDALSDFDPLMIYVGKDSLSGSQLEDGWLMSRNQIQAKSQPSSKSTSDTFSTTVYDEIESLSTCMELTMRYFETWDMVFPQLVDRVAFDQEFSTMLMDPKSVSICFVIQNLVMQALANATYSPDKALLQPRTVARWLDIASGIPISAVEIGEIHLKYVRLAALINLAEQVLLCDPTAGYIRSGTTVRTAMSLGFHRSERLDGIPPWDDRHSVWSAVVELDQNASWAAGMPPSAPDPHSSTTSLTHSTDGDLLRDLDQTNLRKMLANALSSRHKILVALNDQKHLRFEQVLELNDELTHAFSPISTREDVPPELRTFQFRYISYIYRRYLAALYRPFATMPNAVFGLARDITIRSARQYLQVLCAVYHKALPTSLTFPPDADKFAPLLLSQGTMFRAQLRQVVLTLCHEIYTGSHEMHASAGQDDPLIIETFKLFFGIAETGVKRGDFPGRLFLVPAMVYAHKTAISQYVFNSAEYCQLMARAGREAEKCVRGEG